MDRPRDQVVPLDELTDYEVASGEPDVRGWDVICADGRRAGEVAELLVDYEAGKVRYLEVGVAHDVAEFTAEGARRVLIPVGHTRLHEDADQVHVDSLTSEQLAEIPAYRRAAFDRSYETALRRHFGDEDGGGSLGASEARGIGADEMPGGAGTRRAAGAIVPRVRAIVDLPEREVEAHGGTGQETGLGRV